MGDPQSPIAEWLRMENPLKMDALGVPRPHFRKPQYEVQIGTIYYHWVSHE